MEIIREIEDKYVSLFSKSAIALHNAFMIKDKEILCYEFEIFGFKAILHANTTLYLEEVIEEFHFFNAVISEFEYQGKIIKTYPVKQIIRLPISILQPSQFYISKDKLQNIEDYMLEEDVYIPVALIDDEYVILDGHTRLYSLYQNGSRMVNCYFDDYFEYIQDFVYLAKEQNIMNVSKMPLLDKNQYDRLWNQFCDSYFAMKNE